MLLHAVLMKQLELALQSVRSLKGQMMEHYMHATLPQGGNFQIR